MSKPIVIDEKEAEELMRKPLGELKINESVYVLHRKVGSLEKRIHLLESDRKITNRRRK